MRLIERLDEDNNIRIIYVDDDQVSSYPYAILSHTWFENNNDEVTFSDFQNGIERGKEDGYDKIRFCVEQAGRDGLRYCWIDTCCIDKRNSQELNEAITSMFAWYRNATICYAYLADVVIDITPNDENSWESSFRTSRWFRRGFTLQELLAPTVVKFFSKDEVYMGDKVTLQDCIYEITGIPIRALKGADLSTFPVEHRYSWYQDRQTKKKEDKAYCMLGIFNVFIPLMYGEGENAIFRLKEAIKAKETEYAQQEEILVTITWATGAAFNSHHNEFQPRCHPATRKELLEDINQWVYTGDERCLCWLNGKAGTGKSTIARTVAHAYHELGRLGASFFFSKGSGDLSNASRFVATICRQLAIAVPAIRRYICEAIEMNEKTTDQTLRDQWDQLIIGPLSRLDSTTCRSPLLLVIDALDECDSKQDVREILRLLATARLLKNVRLRILLSGRPDLPVLAAFKTIPEAERHLFVLDEVPSTLINRDIKVFFDTQLALIRRDRKLPKEWPGQRNVEMLVESSCKLFIWSSIACRFIHEGRLFSERRISKLIGQHRSRSDPERQLDHIYITVLENAIPDDVHPDQKMARIDEIKTTLGRVVALHSPLSMESLATLLGQSIDDVQNSLLSIQTVLRSSTGTAGTIHLYHPTLRDFLLDKTRSGPVNFWIDEKEMNQSLAKSCIEFLSNQLESYLTESDRSQYGRMEPQGSAQRNIHALRYACLYWVEHYRRSGVRLRDNDKVHKFFEKHFRHWFETMRRLGKNAEMGAIIRLYHSLLTPIDNPRQLTQVKSARRFIVTYKANIRPFPSQSTRAGGEVSAYSHSPPYKQMMCDSQPWGSPSQISDALTLKGIEEYNYVNDLVFTPDGKRIASGSSVEVARLWNLATLTKDQRFDGAFTEKVSSIAISACGKWLAAGSDDYTVVVWELKSRKKIFTLNAHNGWVNSIVFSPDGTILATGSMDETVVLWNMTTGRQRAKLEGQVSCVNSLIWSADGVFIATGSVDGVIRVWNVSTDFTGQPLMLDGNGGCINSVKFSPDSKHIASGSDDMTVRLWGWDWGTQSSEEKLSLKGHSKKVVAVTVSPDASYIVSGSEDKTIRLWNAASGSPHRILRGHNCGINAVAFSPNGKFFVSGSFDDQVQLWSTRDWRPVGRFEEFETDQGEPSIDPMIPCLGEYEGLPITRARTIPYDFAKQQLMVGYATPIGCAYCGSKDHAVDDCINGTYGIDP